AVAPNAKAAAHAASDADRRDSTYRSYNARPWSGRSRLEHARKRDLTGSDLGAVREKARVGRDEDSERRNARRWSFALDERRAALHLDADRVALHERVRHESGRSRPRDADGRVVRDVRAIDRDARADLADDRVAPFLVGVLRRVPHERRGEREPRSVVTGEH